MAFRALLIAASGALLLAQPTFHATTRLIQVSVIVHDHKGEPVTGLTQDQFEVFDQGRRQKIVFFSEQTGQPRSAQSVQTPQNPRIFSNRTDASGSFTVVLFDQLNTSIEDSALARSRVEKFLQKVQPGDRIALYGLSGRLVVLHDFTDDSAALVQAFDRFHPGQSMETTATTFKESHISDMVDGMINDTNQRLSDLYMQSRAEQTAAVMEAIANHLAGLAGRKSLVWVSGSFPASIGYLQKRLRGTRPEKGFFDADVVRAGNALSNGNLTIYPVDARALTALGDVFNASTSPKLSAPALTTRTTQGRDVPPAADRETMYRLAEATGGRVFLNTNDIEGAMRQAMDDSRSTYMVGYYPDHDQWNGKFREIKVQVRQPGVEVRYRRGYLAVADPAPAPALGVEQVAAQPLESSELGLSVEFEPAGMRQFKAHVRIDTAGMRFEQKDGRWIGALDVLWVEVGADGSAVGSNQHQLHFRLSPETYRAAARDGLKISSMETIDEKAVELRLAARDPETGASGSVYIPVRGLMARP